MKIILTKDVKELGNKGDIVEVAAGYARNYLLPRSLAVPATRGSLRQSEMMKKSREDAARRAKEAAQELQRTLEGTRVVVAARSGDEGKLFGSIGIGDVCEAITKFTGIDLDRKLIVVENPIREIGLHEITVRPHPEVEFQVTLDVIPA